MNWSKNLGMAFGGAFLLALICIVLVANGVYMPAELFLGIRWLALFLGVAYGISVNKLTNWIMISMLIGGEIGYTFPQVGVQLDVLSKIFLKLIKTIIAPLLFGTLVVGIAGHSDIKQVGRMGLKSFGYFISVTFIALAVGLIAINLTQAGAGIHKPDVTQTVQKAEKNWQDIVLHIFPENIAKSIYEGQVLQIVVFSILFGIGMTMIHQRQRQVMLDFAESLSEVMFKFTNIVMLLAPLAVGGAIAYTIGKYGLGVLQNLGLLLLTLYGALIAFLVLVLLPIAWFNGIPILKFIKFAREPFTLAFATASSESALPKALKQMEDFGVPRKIVAFVIPTGYSFNLDGTTLYLSLAAIFVAQAAGIQLSWTAQISMLLLLLLTSKGVAGIPRASLMILSGAAASFDLPDWPIAMIIGIDALMDMARTSVNVLGNCLASAVIAKWEGEFDPNYEPQPDEEEAIVSVGH
ncbi:MAG: cation:dicarboxylase symporter family transporter [Microscillaceae bacterium]|jgi:proton glutamate symport protein|nr:cation:dicarboxylase symporter family transporter [Microscillaceae bacterium]